MNKQVYLNNSFFILNYLRELLFFGCEEFYEQALKAEKEYNMITGSTRVTINNYREAGRKNVVKGLSDQDKNKITWLKEQVQTKTQQKEVMKKQIHSIKPESKSKGSQSQNLH